MFYAGRREKCVPDIRDRVSGICAGGVSAEGELALRGLGGAGDGHRLGSCGNLRNDDFCIEKKVIDSTRYADL